MNIKDVPEDMIEEKKYILIGKGDNKYTERFASINGVYAFLYSILENLEEVDYDKHPQYDIEDDQIILNSPEGIFYCNGWHWSRENVHKELLMPDGESFYRKATKL